MPRDAEQAPEVGPLQTAPAAAGSDVEARGTSGRLRRVLVIAYYFPPMGLSGVQRTAKFVKYLPDAGWEPTVLTCEPGGYFAFDHSLLEEIEDAGIEIIRTRGWDPTRLFRGKEVVTLPDEHRRRWFATFSQFLFAPDNKIGWFSAARRAGLEALDRLQHDAIFSTAPPYTSHLVGRSLSVRTGTPLVLDFRDDWLGNPRHAYPTSLHRSVSAKLERNALQTADRVVAVNEFIRRNLLHRNLGVVDPEDVVVISQGYDPRDFERKGSADLVSERFTLVYAGVFYDAQTPDYFLHGLADLLSRRPELRDRIEAVFVGLLPVSAAEVIARLGLDPVVRHTGYLPHDDAIAYLCASDVLWMTVGRAQGAETISTSKLFEYFGARKPVLGLVPSGAARDALQRYEAAEIVEPDAVSEISAAIERLFEAWENNRLPVPKRSTIEQFDRRKLAKSLGTLFDGVLAAR